tara:strand:+ start:138 stop:341 length:204 start_codon:yes stop_codon:yes gene_type:complete
MINLLEALRNEPKKATRKAPNGKALYVKANHNFYWIENTNKTNAWEADLLETDIPVKNKKDLALRDS